MQQTYPQGLFLLCITPTVTDAALAPPAWRSREPGKGSAGVGDAQGTPQQRAGTAGAKGTMPKAIQLSHQTIHFFHPLPVGGAKGACE